MIQRIQTVYLLLSALLLGLMFFLPLAHAIGPENSVFRIMVWGYDDPTASSSPIVNSLTLAATTLLGATIVLEIITVFRYKKRRLQKRLCTAQIVLLLLTAGVTALRIAFCLLLVVRRRRLRPRSAVGDRGLSPRRCDPDPARSPGNR